MYPKLITIGDWFLPTYGVLVATAFLVALWLSVKLGRQFGLSAENITNLGIYCAFAGLLGAKLFMFLFDFEYYRQHPGEIFSKQTLQAAGVFHGGLLTALIAAYFYMRRTNLPPFLTADVFAPGLALGHGIGRLGCFAAGCCWGVECKLPWAVTFTNPDAHQFVGVPLGVPLHPTQLYEMIAEVLIFAILFYRIRRPHGTGEIIGLYLVLYSAIRFLIEFLRAHEQPLQGPFSLTQWIALGFLAVGVWLLVRSRMSETNAKIQVFP